MGWEYTQGATKQDIINAETKTQTVGAVTQTCLDKALNGARLWTVFEHTYSDGRPAKRIICLFLLENHAGFGWGYKDLDESCGPIDDDCPLRMLDMVPDPGGYATAWRERVRQYHAKQAAGRHMAKSLMPGVTVRLGEAYGRRTFVIRERNKTKIYAAEVTTGRMFQLPPKALQDAEIVTA